MGQCARPEGADELPGVGHLAQRATPKSIDEWGISLAMARLYGRAPNGERVTDAVPQNYGQHVIILGGYSRTTGLFQLLWVCDPRR
jgi:hypothetical protein